MLILLFVLSYFLPVLLPVGKIAALLLCAILAGDGLVLFLPATRIKSNRILSRMLSLGDENPVTLRVANLSPFTLKVEVFDELPAQFQLRTFRQQFRLQPGQDKVIRFSLRPLKRGNYTFGHTNAIITTVIGLFARRFRSGHPQDVPVYPSIIQMNRYAVLAFAAYSSHQGIRRMRRLGHSYEFEQIKNYALGDDIRSINWKATSRRHTLMVNQYEDERSQQVYTIIDKSRNMHMPFNGLSLLDYAINTSLVISNIAIKKHDKVGYITFSHRIGSAIPAERSATQLKKIMHALYNDKPQPQEANYDLLYRAVKNVIRSRSLVFLYINFESMYAAERALPILQRINHIHLLVVMMFENTELIDYGRKKAEFVSDIYAQTIASKLVHDKKTIAAKLRKHGIQTLISKPEELSINTVNKYLELKSRGAI